MRAAGLAILLAAQAAPVQGKHDPIQNWQYRRTEINPATGVEELSVEIRGREATPIDLTKGREIFELKGVTASYWTDPRPSERRKSEKIDVRAERARMDNAARVLRLEDKVRVANTIEGSVLTAPRVTLSFRAAWACATCSLRREGPGDCSRGHGPLKEKTAVTVEAPETFDYASPTGALRGHGLTADDALTDVAVQRDGFIEILGDPRALAAPPGPRPAGEKGAVAQIASRGPMTLLGDPADPAARRVTARGGVRIDRMDAGGTTTAEAQEAEIRLLTPPGKAVPGLDRVTARGNVRLTTTTTREGRALKASGDEAVLERHEIDGVPEDRFALQGRPARAAMGESTVEAPRIRYRNPEGIGEFEGGVRAEVSGLRQGAAPVVLRSQTLKVTAEPGGKEVGELDARGSVEIDGLLASEDRPGGKAVAERFLWMPLEERGRLESARHVRIEQAGTLICAPEVFLQDGGRTVLLRGPKMIRLTQEREGRIEEFRVSAEGDVFYDAASGRIRLRDRCSIRSAEFRLEADRVDVVLSADGTEVRSLEAAGRIRGTRPAEGVALRGDRLSYDPVRRELRVSGSPYAVATAGRACTLQRELVFSERPDGNGGLLRTTELRGGGGRVRIEIPEGER